MRPNLSEEIRKAQDIRSAVVTALQITDQREILRVDAQRTVEGKAPLKPVLSPKEKAIMDHLKNLQNLTKYCQDQGNFGRFFEYYRDVRLEGLHKSLLSGAKYAIPHRNRIKWMGVVGLEDQHHAITILPLIGAINHYNPLLTVLRRIFDDLEMKWLVGINDNIQSYTKGVIEACIQLSIEYVKKLREAGRADLAKEISKNAHIRNLRYHNEIVDEIAKFMVVMQRISFPDDHQIWAHASGESIKESRTRAWNQFMHNKGPYMEGYPKVGYEHLLKKKKLQKMFEKWGDDEVSRKLTQFHHDHHQDAHAWAEYLTWLHLEKTDSHYINQYVLLPAKEAILHIIEKDMKEMIRKQGEEAEDLQKAIKKAMEDLAKGKKSIPPQVKKEFERRNKGFEEMYKALEKQGGGLAEITNILPQLRQLEQAELKKDNARKQIPSRVRGLERANPGVLGSYFGPTIFFASHYIHANQNQEKITDDLQEVPSHFIAQSKEVAKILISLERMYLTLFHFLEEQQIRIEIEPSLKKWQVTGALRSLATPRPQPHPQQRRAA